MTRLIDHGAGQPATYAAPTPYAPTRRQQQGDPALIRLANSGAGAARYGLKRTPPDSLTHARADLRNAWLTGYDAELQQRAVAPTAYAAQLQQRQAATTSPAVAPDGAYGLDVAKLASIVRYAPR
jgi:hypothetical protein